MESVQESLAEAEQIPFENCTLARALADKMRSGSDELTRRWLDRISARVTMDPNRIFPTDALLDHVPLLILGIADYIENPEKVILSEIPVVAKAPIHESSRNRREPFSPQVHLAAKKWGRSRHFPPSA